MSAVQKILPVIRERIASYQGLGIHEMDTRASLINPILNALGWRVGDLGQVRLEFRCRPSDNPVDYALMDQDKPRLFVEAKALGKDLSDHKSASQIMGYASVAGVDWVVLTDGNEYRIYHAHASVPVEEKLFRRIRLADDGASAIETLDLLSRAGLHKNRLEAHWQAQLVDREVASVLKALFEPEPDKLFVSWLVRRTKDLKQREVADSLRRVRALFDFSAPPPPLPPPPPPSRSGNELKLLIATQHVQTPHELHTTYKRQRITARVMGDGSVVYREQKFSSLSSAATAARRYVSGTPGARFPTNGWTFWKFTNADGQVKEMDVLRKRYLAGNESDAS